MEEDIFVIVQDSPSSFYSLQFFKIYSSLQFICWFALYSSLKLSLKIRTMIKANYYYRKNPVFFYAAMPDLADKIISAFQKRHEKVIWVAY